MIQLGLDSEGFRPAGKPARISNASTAATPATQKKPTHYDGLNSAATRSSNRTSSSSNFYSVLDNDDTEKEETPDSETATNDIDQKPPATVKQDDKKSHNTADKKLAAASKQSEAIKQTMASKKKAMKAQQAKAMKEAHDDAEIAQVMATEKEHLREDQDHLAARLDMRRQELQQMEDLGIEKELSIDEMDRIIDQQLQDQADLIDQAAQKRQSNRAASELVLARHAKEYGAKAPPTTRKSSRLQSKNKHIINLDEESEDSDEESSDDSLEPKKLVYEDDKSILSVHSADSYHDDTTVMNDIEESGSHRSEEDEDPTSQVSPLTGAGDASDQLSYNSNTLMQDLNDVTTSLSADEEDAAGMEQTRSQLHFLSSAQKAKKPSSTNRKHPPITRTVTGNYKPANTTYVDIRYPSECCQLMHHAYVLKAEKAIFLVGDNRQLLYGILVSFPQDLLLAYGRVLRSIYISHLKWAYSDRLEISDDRMTTIRQSIKRLKSCNIDVCCFVLQLKIWRRLNVTRLVPSEIRFPLPPCQYVVPLVCAKWNLTKGPSDTTTKIMDQSFQERLGVQKPQTIATAQLILIGLIVSLHRVKQIATANVDLNRYKSLESFHDSARKRSTASSSLESVIAVLVPLSKKPPVLDEQHVSFAPTPPRPRQSSRHVQNISKRYCELVGVHCTPGKGNRRPKVGSVLNTMQQRERERSENCPGNSFGAHVAINNNERLDPKKLNYIRRKCVLCDALTAFVCLGCKRHLCTDKVRTGEEAAPFVATSATRTQDGARGNDIAVVYSCFQKAHSDNWEAYWKERCP